MRALTSQIGLVSLCWCHCALWKDIFGISFESIPESFDWILNIMLRFLLSTPLFSIERPSCFRYHYHSNPGTTCPSSQGSTVCFPQIEVRRNQWRIQNFPDGGWGPNAWVWSKKIFYLHFLHENERNWTDGGACPWCPPLICQWKCIITFALPLEFFLNGA